MSGLRIGVMHNTINSRFGPKPLIQADYMTGLAAGSDSFWVADHLNSVLPPSMWKAEYVGAAKIIPKMDAHVEPWTMLGYLAGHNKIGRMTLGVAVTDTGRRNPAVTAQAVVTLQHLTRGRAILGIGTGEREGNEPYGVEWSKPVSRFEEAMATIRALWDSNGELVSRDSPFFPLHNATFALTPFRGKWPEIWIAAHGPRMIRAAGKYGDGWFPGTTRADEYAKQLNDLRAAASDAGRDPMSITPAGIRFILTGRAQDEIDEILDSNLVKLFVLNSSAEDWERHGAQHPMGPEFKGVQDLIPQLIDEETALKYAAMAPRGLVKELFAVGMPDEVVDQLAMFRDSGMQCLVVGNMGALHPKLARSAAAMMPYLKVLRRLKKL
ncbi:photosystem I reaction center subunit VIII [Mycobacterium sp. E1715]|uniref:LLM class flavin-dependent oxidoreductase n=1 Tax=Mycobacterium sp. E1715 TaxID=1856863 RepID=UPI0008024EA7|nr:LLM class flavin-dependent oxidoreductase [Mycobacterium sp. E1715]OBH33221.1 photosystem I reaction center subunit VIII [Mycobacterium sp. E1715]